MLIYLDSNIVIFFVEKRPIEGPKVAARLATAYSAGDTVAISDLTRMECQVGPLKSGDASLLADFGRFFGLPTVSVLGLTAAVFDRAARIRATHGFKPLDSLHLAGAVEHGCGLFLTNDVQLARFPDIRVEILT
ncbi:MAG TPA: PIN domain-containing protein [Gemmataceae bacterium]|jgi:predicted nucleic acid-binding protein